MANPLEKTTANAISSLHLQLAHQRQTIRKRQHGFINTLIDSDFLVQFPHCVDVRIANPRPEIGVQQVRIKHRSEPVTIY
jgi:hypothetical protein